MAAGVKTGFGNPRWLDTHDAAAAHAPVVQTLLDAGASAVGKTQMDELAYSINGEPSRRALTSARVVNRECQHMWTTPLEVIMGVWLSAGMHTAHPSSRCHYKSIQPLCPRSSPA
jgi:hypothetical protein